MPNRAVVMSGGGSKGAFQVGALDYLINDLRLDFQVIAGVSTGSLNSVVLAQASSFEELKASHQQLKELWLGIGSDRDIYTSRFLGKLFLFFAKSSMYDPSPLFDKLKRSVSPDRIARSRKELRIGAVNLETGEFCEVDQGQPNLLEWTLASSSMPLFFPPVRIGEEHFVDGGVRSLTPLQGAFQALNDLAVNGDPDALDEMYVILASPLETEPETQKWSSGLKVGQRAAAILINQIYREDLDYALQVNESVRAYRDLRNAVAGHLGPLTADQLLSDARFPFRPPEYREVRLRTILPDREFAESLQFEPGRIREAFAAGREAARSHLDDTALAALLEKTSPRKEIRASEVLARTA